VRAENQTDKLFFSAASVSHIKIEIYKVIWYRVVKVLVGAVRVLAISCRADRVWSTDSHVFLIPDLLRVLNRALRNIIARVIHIAARREMRNDILVMRETIGQHATSRIGEQIHDRIIADSRLSERDEVDLLRRVETVQQIERVDGRGGTSQRVAGDDQLIVRKLIDEGRDCREETLIAKAQIIIAKSFAALKTKRAGDGARCVVRKNAFQIVDPISEFRRIRPFKSDDEDFLSSVVTSVTESIRWLSIPHSPDCKTVLNGRAIRGELPILDIGFGAVRGGSVWDVTSSESVGALLC